MQYLEERIAARIGHEALLAYNLTGLAVVQQNESVDTVDSTVRSVNVNIPYLYRSGLRRHVADLGPWKLLCLSAVVVAYFGTFLSGNCALQMHSSLDGRRQGITLEAEVSKRSDTSKGMPWQVAKGVRKVAASGRCHQYHLDS